MELDASKTLSGVALDFSSSEAIAAAAAAVPTATETQSDTWTCSFSTNCMEVYKLSFTQTDTLSIAVSSVTGGSVLRLAFYSGTALNGTNLLNGSTNERTCPAPPTAGNQDQPDSTSLAIPSTGIYTLTVGRDWGASLSGTGTFSLNLSTTQSSMTGFTKTATDIATQATGMSCP
ncbi:hypothetical protein EHQ53_09580 [Leptospira langatensis]|uniref:Peptidase C-terminal archaeal/bacterial domain-containing protein n=1 Tax=Leptospira langatensis TaxID=2484983 RepID=A0A5F1ZSQ3_9LEPT|nr:hypothetical protein EHO57_13610 [Leptospira langatensis]TGL41200.1 hypothetical protein EHQ53_09580 [Leptospira langatensis]